MDALELGEEMCWPMLKLLFSYQRSSFWTFSIFIRPNLTREAFSLLMFESWKSETQNYLFHLVFWPFFHSVECLYRLEEGNFKSIFTEMWCGHFVAEINLGNLRFFVCFSVPRGDVCPPTTRKLFHVYLILCARNSDSTLREFVIRFWYCHSVFTSLQLWAGKSTHELCFVPLFHIITQSAMKVNIVLEIFRKQLLSRCRVFAWRLVVCLFPCESNIIVSISAFLLLILRIYCISPWNFLESFY